MVQNEIGKGKETKENPHQPTHPKYMYKHPHTKHKTKERK
jgi:hypothetical protein